MAEAMEAVSSMSKEHRKILRRNRPILEDIQAMQLLPHLTEILSQEDDENVKAEKTRTDQARALLDLVPLKGPTAFKCFVKSLWEVQPHLAKKLSEEAGLEVPSKIHDIANMVSLPQDLREKLRNSTLRQVLKDVKIDQILILMNVVFTKTDEECISSKTTVDEKWDEFLSVLPKKGRKAFDHFVAVLEMSSHKNIAKYLKGEANFIDLEHQEESLTKPVPIAYQTPLSDIKDKLQEFYIVLNNENNGSQKLAQEFQLPQEYYRGNPNPSHAVITDWIKKEGDMANVSVLTQALVTHSLYQSKACLEKVVSPNWDATDAPSNMNNVVTQVQNLSIADEKTTAPVPSKLEHLKPAILTHLQAEISQDARERGITINAQGIKNLEIREVTKYLRENSLKESIKWMKKNLPAGVTGPLLEENVSVRDLPYRVRSALTIKLTVNDNWIPLAERLGIDKANRDYFDQRHKNAANEVLTYWETKRNSTIGDLYDILVELDMPVIADIL